MATFRSRPTRPLFVGLLTCGLMLPVPPVSGRTEAQERPRPADGRVHGTVRAGTEERALPGADVLLDGPERRSAVTDERGQFRMEALRPGRYAVRVSHLAYQAVEVEIDVAGENQLTVIQIQLLPDAIPIDPVTVTVERPNRPTTGALGLAYDRMDYQKRLGLGRFVTREDIERQPQGRLTSVLSNLGGTRLHAHPQLPGGYLVELNRAVGDLNERNWVTPSGVPYCPPVYVIDGVRTRIDVPTRSARNAPPPQSVDDFVRPQDIALIEIYRRVSQIPAEFGGSDPDLRCGVIAIWTRRGH
jgi:hypothetical protein